MGSAENPEIPLTFNQNPRKIPIFRGPADQGATYDERILEIRRDPNRTCHIALCAGINGKRWILATENMKFVEENRFFNRFWLENPENSFFSTFLSQKYLKIGRKIAFLAQNR